MRLISLVLIFLSLNTPAKDYLCNTRLSSYGHHLYMNNVFTFDNETKVNRTIFKDYIIERKLAYEDEGFYGAWVDIKIIWNKDTIYSSRNHTSEPTQYIDWKHKFSFLHSCQKCDPSTPEMCPDVWKVTN
jgi:hypothetical protein